MRHRQQAYVISSCANTCTYCQHNHRIAHDNSTQHQIGTVSSLQESSSDRHQHQTAVAAAFGACKYCSHRIRRHILCLTTLSLLCASQNYCARMPNAQPAKPCRSSSSLGVSKHNPSAQSRKGSEPPASSSDSPSGSDSEYTSEEEADQTVKRLQRLNSIQKGYVDRQSTSRQQDDKSICCWGEDGDGQPRDHTSRWVYHTGCFIGTVLHHKLC